MKYSTLALTFILASCKSSSAPVETPPEEVPDVVSPAAVPATPVGPPATQAASVLTLVSERTKVCMVNDQFFSRAQIPVEVDGKTYFGCCEMCKGRLASDPSVRSGKDPVSGKLVDKATALIGATPNGGVLYFENQENFDRYRATR
jgi:YHS domain-containing protein